MERTLKEHLQECAAVVCRRVDVLGDIETLIGHGGRRLNGDGIDRPPGEYSLGCLEANGETGNADGGEMRVDDPALPVEIVECRHAGQSEIAFAARKLLERGAPA